MPFTIVHLKLKVKGKPKDVSTFFQLMRSLDWDFPIGTGKLPETGKCYTQCDCGGFVWKGAALTKEEIMRGAKQCNVTVKKLSMILEGECQKNYQTCENVPFIEATVTTTN
jgi:hypothetical protein